MSESVMTGVLEDLRRQLEGWSEPENSDSRRMLYIGRSAIAAALSLKAELERCGMSYRGAAQEATDSKLPRCCVPGCYVENPLHLIAKLKASEAERDALRARVSELEGALASYRFTDARGQWITTVEADRNQATLRAENERLRSALQGVLSAHQWNSLAAYYAAICAVRDALSPETESQEET